MSVRRILIPTLPKVVASSAIVVAILLSGEVVGLLSLHLLGIDRTAYLDAFAQEGRSTHDSLLRRIEDDPSVARRFLHDVATLGLMTWVVQVTAVYVIVGATLEWVASPARGGPKPCLPANPGAIS